MNPTPQTKLFLLIFLITSFSSMLNAQTRLSYGDTIKPPIDVETNLTINNASGDTGVILGYAERFDLPVDQGILDSVYFIADSMGSDSIFVDIVPVMTTQTSYGPEFLPNLDATALLKVVDKQFVIPGSWTSVGCNKTNVANSFFIMLFNKPDQGNRYRANEETSIFSFDTARAAIFALEPSAGVVITELVDGNLINPNMDVNMDIGITYENADGVQVHLSPSNSAITAYPNPTPLGNSVHLSNAGTVTSATLVDEAGRTVREYRGNDSSPLTDLSTQGLSSGVYQAVLYYSDGSESSVRFVVE